MSIPKKLIICGQIFNVYKRDNIKEDGQDCLGLSQSNENTIYIKNGLQKDREEEILLHESLHAIDDLLDLKLGERRVNTLGVILLDFLKTNKLKF